MARGKLNQGQQTGRQIRVGAVLIVAMIVLAFGIFQVGKLFDVFASRYTLITLIEDSGGLIEGSPVTLAGQRIGQIQSVEFLPVEARRDSANIIVHFSVNQNVQSQIRRDSRGVLQTQGLLGDRYLNISPGSPGYATLQPGDTLVSLRPLDYESVLRTAANTLDHVQGVVIDLRTLTERINAGEGTLGALMTDDVLYHRMTTATTDLAGLLNSINRSDGSLARIIRDPALYNQMNVTLARLDSLGAAIIDGEGSLGLMMRDDSLYRGLVGVVGRADSTLAGVEVLVDRVAEGDGTLARLMEDPQLYDELLKTIVDLQAVIQAVREDPSALSPQIQVEVF